MTKNEVSNLAISNIGLTTTVIDIDNERSIEAKKCRLYFPVAFKESLEECRYGSRAVFKALDLVLENPTTEWKYAYRYPSNCLFLSRLLRSAFNLTETYPYVNGEWDVDYREAHDENHGHMIYTNEYQAKAEYYVLEGPQEMSAKFWLGLSFRLSAYIAPALTKTDADKVVARMNTQARKLFQEAQAKNWNEQKFKEEDPRSSLEISRRGY